MADKNIGSLPKATSLDRDSLLVMERQDEAMSLDLGQLQDFAKEGVDQYVTDAQTAANEAKDAAAKATQEVENIGTAVDDTKAAQAAAENAAQKAEDALANMGTAAEDAERSAQAAAQSEANAKASEEGVAANKTAAENAQKAAETARDESVAVSTATEQNATVAATAAQNAGNSATLAGDAAANAEAARQAIENMMVEAITVATGNPATVSKELVDGVVKLVFSLPQGAQGDKGNAFTYDDFTDEQLAELKGEKGDAFEYDDFTEEQLAGLVGPSGNDGNSIQSITRTSGNGAPGTTDTYTITLTTGETFDFYVYNGADGIGSGDMSKSVYDPQGKATDIFEYVDNAVKDVKVTTDEIPIPESTNPVQSGGVAAALDKKQDNLSGTQGQFVGFDAEKNPVPANIGATDVTFSDGDTFQDKYDSGELVGKPGDPGVGIESVEQTTTSTEDGGENIVTVRKTDGSTSTFSVRNGGKGNPGEPGSPGSPGTPGTNATINGVNALNITTDEYLSADQDGDTLKLGLKSAPTKETWVFTLEDGSTVEKVVYTG